MKKNLLGLALSFALGQGSIFLAQSFLLINGSTTRLADFGVAFSFSTLALLIGEYGASVRMVSLFAREHGDTALVVEKFWDITCQRTILALIALPTIAAYLIGVDSEGFYSHYLSTASAGLLVSALSAGCILEAKSQSGKVGLFSVIPHILVALTAVLTSGWASAAAGLAIGAAFAVGCATATFASWMVVEGRREYLAKRTFRVSRSLGDAWSGLSIVASNAPGQLFFRIQLSLSELYLGKEITAFFLYARQIAAAVSQLVNMLARVRFPKVAAGATSDASPVKVIFLNQKEVALAAFGSSSTILFVAYLMEGSHIMVGYGVAVQVVAYFSVGITTGALYIMTYQGLQAYGKYTAVAITSASAAMVGAVASYWLVQRIGVLGLAVGEVSMHVLGGLTLLWLVRKAK